MITRLAHERLSPFVSPGSVAIDATVGNGYDTAFLARGVGPEGHVFGFDIQLAAIESARSYLDTLKLVARVTFVTSSHEALSLHLPPDICSRVTAVMWNLGYLPGSNKIVTTQADTTTASIRGALSSFPGLRALSILSYRGHDGGTQEHEAVRALLGKLDSVWHVEEVQASSSELSPVLWIVERKP